MQINYKRANTTPSVHEMTRQEESTRPKYYRTFISIYGFEQAGKILITLVSSKLFMYSHLRAGFGFSPSRRPRRRQPSPSLISLISINDRHGGRPHGSPRREAKFFSTSSRTRPSPQLFQQPLFTVKYYKLVLKMYS